MNNQSERAAMCESLLRRAEQLSAKKEKVRNEGSSAKFDDELLQAFKEFEDAGIPYANEVRRTYSERKAQGFALSNDAPNSSAYEYAVVFLWLVTKGRDDADFCVWLKRDRNDHLRRGDREHLEEFAARLAPGAKARTLSRIARKEIRLLRALMDCMYS